MSLDHTMESLIDLEMAYIKEHPEAKRDEKYK